MDWSEPTAQLLGRFQPWHEGHTELFKRALTRAGQVVILLRAEDGSQNNPWTQEERMGFIIEALQNEGYTWNKEFTIIFVPNITHITYGRDVGYKIQKESFEDDIENISATDKREEIFSKGFETNLGDEGLD